MKAFFFFLLMVLGGISFAQNRIYPDDYLGIWKGELLIQPAGLKVPMSLQLGPAVLDDSVYRYILTYILPNGEEDRREYELRVNSRENGNFEIDEKNGILLSEKRLGNKITSIFEVDGSQLLISLELNENFLIWEVYSWLTKNKKPTGGQEDIPFVYSFSANGYQRAVLKK